MEHPHPPHCVLGHFVRPPRAFCFRGFFSLGGVFLRLALAFCCRAGSLALRGHLGLRFGHLACTRGLAPGPGALPGPWGGRLLLLLVVVDFILSFRVRRRSRIGLSRAPGSRPTAPRHTMARSSSPTASPLHILRLRSLRDLWGRSRTGPQ